MRAITRRELLRSAGILGASYGMAPWLATTGIASHPVQPRLYTAQIFSEDQFAQAVTQFEQERPYKHIIEQAKRASETSWSGRRDLGWGGALFWGQKKPELYGRIVQLPLAVASGQRRGLGVLIMGEVLTAKSAVFLTTAIDGRCVMAETLGVRQRRDGKCKVRVAEDVELSLDKDFEIEVKCEREGTERIWKGFIQFFAKVGSEYEQEYDAGTREELRDGPEAYLCKRRGEIADAWKRLWSPLQVRVEGLVFLSGIVVGGWW